MEFVTETFVHRGHRLTYDVYGGGDRVLVYMHGLLLDAEMNRGIAEAVAAQGHRVVLLDLLGHGRSDKPTRATEYRIDAYADQVFALLDHLGIPEAVLGGASLGANVSLFAASRRPDRVRGLVLEMPVLEWAVPSAALFFTPLLLLVHYGRGLARAVGSVARHLPRLPFGAANSIVHAATLRPEVMAAILHGVLVGPVAPTVDERARIAAPTLILAHRHDAIHPFSDAKRLADLMPDAELVGARSPVELRLRPGRLTDVIVDFNAGVWRDDRRRQRPLAAVAGR